MKNENKGFIKSISKYGLRDKLILDNDRWIVEKLWQILKCEYLSNLFLIDLLLP